MDVQRGRRRGEEGPGEGAGASGETEPHACHQLLCNAGVMQALNRLLISLLLALGANAPSLGVSECETLVKVSRVHVDVCGDVCLTDTAPDVCSANNLGLRAQSRDGAVRQGNVAGKRRGGLLEVLARAVEMLARQSKGAQVVSDTESR